ncbi:carboxypeptidase-like regulatory domain-containing protein [Flavobacterium sp.]|jgi:hypothetical protein|uniref:carboxypeptidase-like regulatory domain-containing protein n=1 Tax=Flavobacterium sp. TaxID=239 RepID=UPI0037BFC80D
MKKIYILILITCTILSCTKKPGTLTGNVYWKYNNYVGNKPDSGAEITLYAINKSQRDSIFKATADVNGNYTINDIPPAKYLLVIRSKNTTDSPLDHIQNLKICSNDLKNTFDFDINNFSKNLEEIDAAYKKYETILIDSDIEKYGGLSNKINEYEKYQKIAIDKSSDLIDKFPTKVKLKLGLFTGYSKSLYIQNIEIKEEKTVNKNTDFGTTYM